MLISIAIEPTEGRLDGRSVPGGAGRPSSGPADVLLRPGAGWHVREKIFDVPKQHFIKSLWAPADGLGGIWVGRVLVAVIKPGSKANSVASVQGLRLGIAVEQLPVEVVAGDVEKGLGLSLLVNHVIAAGGTTQMQVRQEAEQGGIDRQL